MFGFGFGQSSSVFGQPSSIAGGNSQFRAYAANPFSGSTTSMKPFGSQTTGSSSIFGGNSTGLFGVTSSAFSPSSALGASSLSTPFGTNSNASPLAGGSSGFGTLNSTATNNNGFGGGSFNFGVKPISSGFKFGTTSQQQSQPAPFRGFCPSNSSVVPSTSSSSPFSSFTGFNSSNSKTPALSGTSNGIGSRVAAYTPTRGKDEKQVTIILQSISALPAYAHKSHEELRREDYQSGDKGGPCSFSTASSNNNVNVNANGLFASKPNLWQTSLATQFAPSSTTSGSLQASSPSIFSPSNTNNPFALSGKQGTTSSPLFNPFNISSATTATSSSSSPFEPASSSVFGPFSTSSATTSGSLQTSSPSIFSPSNTNNPFAPSGKPGTTSSPLFNPFKVSSATAAASSSSSAFGPASSPVFGPFNTSSAPTSNTRPPFNAQTGGSNYIAPDPFSNLFGPKNTLSVSQPSQTTPASNVQTGGGNSLAPANPFTNIFAPQNSLPVSQPTQTTPPFTPGYLSESQSAATRYPFSSGGMFDLNQPVKPSASGIFCPSNSAPVVPTKTLAPTQTHSAPLSTSQGSSAVQSAPATNPFGTLAPIPEVCVGTRATTATTPPPSVRQYGIASMPAVPKGATVRISSLVRVRNLTRGLHRPPIRKYDPNQNKHRAAFFTKEPLKAPKADTVLLPRENPRALVIRTMDQKPLRTATADNASPFKDTPTADQDNGKNSEVSSGSITGVEDVYLQKEEWNTKGRAGESATVYDNADEIMAVLPKLRFPDWYTEPSIQELAAKERAQPGFCSRVRDFVVGRRGFGNIKFLGETDVRGLDLDALVQINYREVIVYMDESKKHSTGQGLNKPAEITLFDVRCVNRKTGQPHTEGPKIEKVEEILRKKAEDQGAEFVLYEPVRGEWKFRVKHF